MVGVLYFGVLYLVCFIDSLVRCGVGSCYVLLFLLAGEESVDGRNGRVPSICMSSILVVVCYTEDVKVLSLQKRFLISLILKK